MPRTLGGVGCRAAALTVLLVAALYGSPAVAQSSAVAVGVIIEIPTETTVGQRHVAGRIVITNLTAGDGPVRLNQVVYVPACATLSLPCDTTDAGVFALSAGAVGAGGVCAGIPFNVADAGGGRFTFVAQGPPVELPPNGTCTIGFTFDVQRMPTGGALTRAVANVNAQRGSVGSTNFGTANITVRNASAYHPLVPARILDTRDGAGAIGPGATARLQVTGRGGVPATGVTAVALNVVVTQPTSAGFLTLHPAGAAPPLASNLNFTPDKTVPNLVVVRQGEGGAVDLFNSAGSTHVVADVAGWFSDGLTGAQGRFEALPPARILDSRTGVGGTTVRLGPGASLDLEVAGRGGVPAAGADAVVMNVAVTGTTASSHLTVHPAGEARPLASNLNWAAGDTVSNRVIAKLGAGGRLTLYNNAGETDLVVDTNGWFTDAVQTVGSPYVPLTPARILDTRTGTGGIPGPLGAGSTVEVQVTGRGGVPVNGVTAVVLNTTVVSPAGPGWLTIFPTGTAQPVASDLNYAAGEIRPNLVVVKVGAGGKVSLFSPTSAEVIFDVAGFFT